MVDVTFGHQSGKKTWVRPLYLYQNDVVSSQLSAYKDIGPSGSQLRRCLNISLDPPNPTGHREWVGQEPKCSPSTWQKPQRSTENRYRDSQDWVEWYEPSPKSRFLITKLAIVSEAPAKVDLFNLSAQLTIPKWDKFENWCRPCAYYRII